MDSSLKKRLLGAAVLIALAVIFVPMLLPSHTDSGSQSVSLKVPPQPSGEMQTRILKVGPSGASAGSATQVAINDPDHVATLDLANHPAQQAKATTSAAPTASASVPPPAKVELKATTPAPAVSAPTPPPAKAEPEVAKSAPAVSAPVSPQAKAEPEAVKPVPPPASAQAEPIPGGAGAAADAVYTVNLGIYADHASADNLVAKAKKHGFTALATPESHHGQSLMRVRVGPFQTRAQAEAARLKLKHFAHVPMTVDTGVVNQSGDVPASAIAAHQPGGWAVQLAAFSNEAAATKLRDRLRGQGFDGYIDRVNTSKGKLWRVRAGPFASRNVAESARGQIAQKLKMKGDIVTQE